MSSETIGFRSTENTLYPCMTEVALSCTDCRAWRDCVMCPTDGEDAQMLSVWWHFWGIEKLGSLRQGRHCCRAVMVVSEKKAKEQKEGKQTSYVFLYALLCTCTVITQLLLLLQFPQSCQAYVKSLEVSAPSHVLWPFGVIWKLQWVISPEGFKNAF